MSSLKKNFVYNLLYNATRIIFPLITAPYVARVLEPDGIGLYQFSVTYAGYFALVALLGVPTYGVREVAKVKDDRYALNKLVSQIFSIIVISTLFVSIVYLLSLAFIGQLRQDYICFLLAGFCVYLSPFQTNWFYQGVEEFDYITIRSIIVKLLSVLFLFIFVRSKNDIIPYILISVFGTIVADIWNYVKMRTKGIIPKLTFNGLTLHLRPLFLLFASSVAISIYTVLDTLMLGFIKDYSEVGYYSNAMNMSKMFLVIVTSLSVVSVPRFSSYISKGLYSEANKLANRSFSFVGFLAFPLSIGLICIAPIFVPWFFGNQFIGAIIPLEILSVLNIAIGFSNILGVQILVGMGKDKQFLRCIIWGTVSNFILNSILIPVSGAIGASVASVFAEFVVMFTMFYYIYKETPVRLIVFGDILKSFMGSLLFFPLFMVLPYFDNGIIYLSVSFTCSMILYAFSQYILHNSLALEISRQIKEKF